MYYNGRYSILQGLYYKVYSTSLPKFKTSNSSTLRLLTDGTQCCRWLFFIDKFLPSTRLCDRRLCWQTQTLCCRLQKFVDYKSLSITKYDRLKEKTHRWLSVVDNIFRYSLLSMTRLTHSRISRGREIVVDDKKSSTTSGLVCQQPHSAQMRHFSPVPCCYVVTTSRFGL